MPESCLDHTLFKNMIQNNWVAVVFANMENKVEYVNPAACELYGYPESELIGQSTEIFNSNLSHDTESIVKCIKEQGYWSGEIIQRRKDNSTFTSLLSIQLMFNENNVPIGFASNSKDISQDIETASQLRKMVQEKEVLLKEMHHRVKNNLSIIKGILSLQNEQYDDKNSTRLVEDFKNRIDAVATLHNTLYEASNLTDLNLKVFINDLCASINRSFGQNGKEMVIVNNVADYYSNIDKSIPLCLIINEVITNAFKHAFIGVNQGEISIHLERTSEKYTLIIKDNGIGFEVNTTTDQSLGLTLIKELSEQIDATYSYENKEGTTFNIQFNA